MLQDKVAVVTGAGRGIGREIAPFMASRGTRVVVNDLRAELDGEGADASPAAETAADEIFLFSQPHPLHSIQRSEGWTPEAIAEHALPVLEKSFYDLDISADVLSRDPV